MTFTTRNLCRYMGSGIINPPSIKKKQPVYSIKVVISYIRNIVILNVITLIKRSIIRTVVTELILLLIVILLTGLANLKLRLKK